MLCPSCGNENLMGAEECSRCQCALTPLDVPQPMDAVDGSLMTDTVAMLKPRPPVVLSAKADLARAMHLMTAEGVGAVLLSDDQGKLVGILTERDFLTKIAGSEAFTLLPVQQFMTRNPETVSPTDPLAFALRKMAVGNYRHLPVVADDVPIGVISVRDILRHVLALCQPRLIKG
jgi:CBS domain-containing protein